jgi:hypothetical protein
VPALEVVPGPALQLGGEGVQDHAALRNRRRQSQPVCLTSREPHELCDTPA